MRAEVEALFHETADLSPEARTRYFVEHEVDEDTRREVEALLAFDSQASSLLQRDISVAASRALPQLEARGRRCGPYRLLEVIGYGGMGTVYLAERADGEVHQRVAVKLLPPGTGDSYRERFLQERQILASLTHPNIARMLDAGRLENGQPFLAMEYIDGRPIDIFATDLKLRQKIELFLKVCAAVGYLHRNLVVHRDLKPGNILVTDEGEPKLLDFGIAKILDLATESTMADMRVLTPDYASPEQMTGGRVSTAMDIYCLGAVLYRLLTGKAAHQFDDRSPEAVAHAVMTRAVTRPSKWAPELKGDLDFIVLKALRKDPQERYATVEQFAEDLQAFLDSRPVRARTGNAWYRTRKFLRRYWIPVTAAALVIASLSAGLYVANRERAIAQRRFEQVRQLSNKVLELDGVVRLLPGSTKARSEIVAMSQQYLEGLGREALEDQNLALEAAQAYFALAGVQGLPTAVNNLGQYAQAEVSLRRADDLLETILKKSPANRRALLLSGNIAHNRMILADTDHRRQETLFQAGKAVERIDTLLGLGQGSPPELKTAYYVFSNIALAHKNLHLYAEAMRSARRAIEIARAAPSAEVNGGQPLSILADCQRFSGDLEGALQSIREAWSITEKAPIYPEPVQRTALLNVLWREGTILGQDGNVSLNRPAEAAEVLQKAFNLAESWAQEDSNNASFRMLLASDARELGPILAHTDPQRALGVYEKALFRLREIKENTDGRRREAQLLAYSSYVLRRLHRSTEAKDRIDAALGLLRQTKDYPAARINPDDEAYAVMRALGDHLSETGEPQRAAEVYRDLLGKIMAYKPDPQNDLRDATKLSRTYASLANLERRIGRDPDAADLDTRRLQLWQQWNLKLPNNPFILRQLAAKPND